jgi:hypothetical protein
VTVRTLEYEYRLGQAGHHHSYLLPTRVAARDDERATLQIPRLERMRGRRLGRVLAVAHVKVELHAIEHDGRAVSGVHGR